MIIYKIEFIKVLRMEAVGGQVIAVIAFPVLVLTALAIYYWADLKAFLRNQFSAAVRIEENNEERQRRQHHSDDKVCSICLTEPKEHEVSSTCGHSFCANCILSLYRHNDEQIKCPLCRQEINLLFKLFESSAETALVEDQLKQYNRMFDDNRSLLRRITQFPYVLKRLWRHFFSISFLIFFLRNLQMARWVFIIVVYILLPFDLIPQHLVGILGYIDDFLLVLFLIAFLMTIAALRYHRMHNH